MKPPDWWPTGDRTDSTNDSTVSSSDTCMQPLNTALSGGARGARATRFGGPVIEHLIIADGAVVLAARSDVRVVLQLLRRVTRAGGHAVPVMEAGAAVNGKQPVRAPSTSKQLKKG